MIRVKIIFIIHLLVSSFLAVGQDHLSGFTTSENFKGAGISLVVFDAVTGEDLISLNEELKLCPASTMKLFTCAAAAESVPNLEPFKTEVRVRGEISQGVLDGDIIIKGFGDPTLGSIVFFDDPLQIAREIANAVKANGIDSITGSILADISWLTEMNLPRTRIWEDMGNYYGGPISGLNYRDNSYSVYYDTRFDPGEKASVIRIEPDIPWLTLTSDVKVSTVQSDQAYIFGSPFESERMVYGTLPLGKESFRIKGSLAQPGLLLAHEVQRMLNEEGIVSNGYGYGEAGPNENSSIMTLYSPDLKDIIQEILHNSNNLFSEALAVRLGANGEGANIEEGLETLNEYIVENCGANEAFQAFDGSGLSRFNAVSSSHFKELILHCNSNSTLKKVVLDQLPQFGKEGTVKYMGRETPLEGNVAAKSGSMTGVLAYSGLFNAKTGRQIGFSVLVNNYNGSSREVRTEVVELLLSVYKEY